MDIIKRTARVFRRNNLKGKVSYDSLKEYLQNKGYSVIVYDINSDLALLGKYGINAAELNANAFTLCTDDFKAVFIDNRVSTDNVVYSLLHEVGHIVLKHLEQDSTYANVRLLDMQAEAFAYEVLSYKSKKHIYITVIMMFFISLSLGIGKYNMTRETVKTESEMVYVTASGTKYHRKNCIYVYNKECSALTAEQAKKNYTPCKVCNP